MDEHPRICYLAEAFYPVTGGIESQGRAFVEYFTRKQGKVLVITGHVPMDSKREEMLFGARVLRIPPSGSKPGKKRWPMIITAFIWLIKERRHFDIIFVDGFRTLGISAVVVGKLFGKKIVLKPENYGEMSGEFFDGRLNEIGLSCSHWLVRPFLFIHNVILKKAHAFCPNTTDTEKEILQSRVETEKLHLLPNVYDSSNFSPASASEKKKLRERFSIDEKRVVAMFTGRLVAWKGPQHLVKIWHQIVDAYNHPLLLLVGPDGNDMFDCSDEIRSYIGENNLQRDVIMTGGVRNVEEYLRASDFFVFPSQGGETATTAIMEAMACGLPIITTSATGVRDLVSPETGLVVESTNFQGFQEAIVTMLEDESLRLNLGQAGEIRARRLYTPERVYSQYNKLFHVLTSSN